jgi:hypothetical protein
MRAKYAFIGLACGLLATVSCYPQQSLAGHQDDLRWADLLPKGLDPHTATDTQMQSYMLNVYDNLYRY